MPRLQMKAFFLPKLWFRGDMGLRARRYTRAVLYTFNLHTLALLALACLSVHVCNRLHFTFNMDFSLCALGSTFPLVFAIQSAFGRRERALSTIAQFKASAVGLYYMHRDWTQDCDYPASMGNNFTPAARACRLLLADLCRAVREFLTAHSHYESSAEARFDAARRQEGEFGYDGSIGAASEVSFAEIVAEQRRKDPGAEALRRCYAAFSRMSVLNEKLTVRSGYTRGGEGGLSRTNQYLRYMIAGVEELRMLREYRTPIMMRYANGVLVHVFSLCLGPFFAHYCSTQPSPLAPCAAGYMVAGVYVVIVMLLYNIAVDLEQPFDAIGLDDVWWTMEEEVVEHTVDAAFLPGTAALMGTRLPSLDDLAGAMHPPGSPGGGGGGYVASRLWAEAHAAGHGGGGGSPAMAASRVGSVDKLSCLGDKLPAWPLGGAAASSPQIRAHRPLVQQQQQHTPFNAADGGAAAAAVSPRHAGHQQQRSLGGDARGIELSFSGPGGFQHVVVGPARSLRVRGASLGTEEEVGKEEAAAAQAEADAEVEAEDAGRPLMGGAGGRGRPPSASDVKARSSLRTSKSD